MLHLATGLLREIIQEKDKKGKKIEPQGNVSCKGATISVERKFGSRTEKQFLGGGG
jgi:hypothetical protein